jgi:hypothetical protein
MPLQRTAEARVDTLNILGGLTTYYLEAFTNADAEYPWVDIE